MRKVCDVQAEDFVHARGGVWEDIVAHVIAAQIRLSATHVAVPMQQSVLHARRALNARSTVVSSSAQAVLYGYSEGCSSTRWYSRAT